MKAIDDKTRVCLCDEYFYMGAPMHAKGAHEKILDKMASDILKGKGKHMSEATALTTTGGEEPKTDDVGTSSYNSSSSASGPWKPWPQTHRSRDIDYVIWNEGPDWYATILSTTFRCQVKGETLSSVKQAMNAAIDELDAIIKEGNGPEETPESIITDQVSVEVVQE